MLHRPRSRSTDLTGLVSGTYPQSGVAAVGGPAIDMERYLGNFFNHNAALINLFGWGVGDADNAFRKVAEARSSIAA